MKNIQVAGSYNWYFAHTTVDAVGNSAGKHSYQVTYSSLRSCAVPYVTSSWVRWLFYLAAVSMPAHTVQSLKP
jgi:hypothetical protein